MWIEDVVRRRWIIGVVVGREMGWWDPSYTFSEQQSTALRTEGLLDSC